MTMRSSTGSERTSSQISIYNYPDHLNPFSEDDNHKRLRFWNLSKRNDNRRRSFSMGNLREFWILKSFSLKKKSSTLGIQKTSESPPVMRRNLESNSLHPGDQAFGNRRPYMNSLQNINTPRGTRSSESNYNYVHSPQRSTISEGYLTPQSHRFHPNRSSQASLISSNPFESDIDSDATDIGSVSLGGCRKSYRKKRRAPLAPTKEMLNKETPSPVKETTMDIQSAEIEVERNKAIRSLAVEIEQFVNNSNETSTVKIPTVVVEPSSVPQSPHTECNISEKPCFNTVPRPSHDAKSDTVKEKTITTANSTSRSDPVTDNVQIDKLNSNIGEIVVSSVVFQSPQTEPQISDHKSSPKAPSRSNASKSEHVKVNNITNTENTSTSDQVTDNAQVDKLSCNVVKIVETSFVSESPQAEHKIPDKKSKPKPPIRSYTAKTELVKENKKPNTEYTSTSDQVTENAQVDNKLNNNVVKIEKTTFASETPQAEHKVPDQICTSIAATPTSSVAEREHVEETKIPNIEYTLTSAPASEVLQSDRLNRNVNQIDEARNLNNFTNVQKYSFKQNNNAENYEYLNKPLAIFENSERKLEERSEDGAQPAKAKSVKEIIDSINRSQKLLKDSAAKGTTVYSTSLYAENNIRPISNQRSSQMPEISPNISMGSSCMENNIQLEQSYFQKSKINKTAFQYRESSPTALNLDWNPLPKPKRINNGSTI